MSKDTDVDTSLGTDLACRIRTLEQTDDARFGAFTAFDWALCVLGALVLPLLALWSIWP